MGLDGRKLFLNLKDSVGGSVIFYWGGGGGGGNYFFVKKCVFYACFMFIGSWKCRKNFFELKLVRVGLQRTNNFLRCHVPVDMINISTNRNTLA